MKVQPSIQRKKLETFPANFSVDQFWCCQVDYSEITTRFHQEITPWDYIEITALPPVDGPVLTLDVNSMLNTVWHVGCLSLPLDNFWRYFGDNLYVYLCSHLFIFVLQALDYVGLRLTVLLIRQPHSSGVLARSIRQKRSPVALIHRSIRTLINRHIWRLTDTRRRYSLMTPEDSSAPEDLQTP